MIVDAFRDAGVAVDEVVACGGLADKSPAIVQLYADIVGLPFRVSASDQAPALGSAMFGAVAAGAEAGGHATIQAASAAMARTREPIARLPRRDTPKRPASSPERFIAMAEAPAPTTASPAPATDYRKTLNLPDTPFPMRGDLPRREPADAEQQPVACG